MDKFYQIYNTNPAAVNQIMPIFIGLTVFFFILVFTLYILQGTAFMKLAERNNMKHGWLSFVPVANTYILGKVAFEDKVKAFIFLGINIILAIISSSYYLLNITGYTANNTKSGIISLLYTICYFYALYKIFKKYSNKAVIMIIFSILSCGLLSPIFLFAIRNNEEV